MGHGGYKMMKKRFESWEERERVMVDGGGYTVVREERILLWDE